MFFGRGARVEPSVSDLRQGVLDREAAIHAFRLSGTLKTDLSLDGKAVGLSGTEHVDICAETGGRLRYESSGQIVNRGRVETERVLAAFNGSEARNMRSAGLDQYRIGEIDRTRGSLFFRIDPLEFVIRLFNRPISEELRRPAVVLVGQEIYDGRPSYVLEVSHAPPQKGADYKKTRFWVDPSRGFVVVKRAALARRSLKDTWQE